MPSIELLVSFIAATAVFAYMPGPAMIYAAAQTIARGRRAGLMAALGIHLGGCAHVVGAALGLSAVFELVPSAYFAVKLAGAAYLIWLGVMMIRRRSEAGGAQEIPRKSAKRAFVESVTVEVLNPKTALFFIAFLPLFVDPAAGLPLWAQFLVLGVIVNVMFSSADLICVLFASSISDRFGRSPRVERIARALGGTLLIGLGTKLALDR